MRAAVALILAALLVACGSHRNAPQAPGGPSPALVEDVEAYSGGTHERIIVLDQNEACQVGLIDMGDTFTNFAHDGVTLAIQPDEVPEQSNWHDLEERAKYARMVQDCRNP